jgi:PilZ domain
MPVVKRRFKRKYFDRVGALDVHDGTPTKACEIVDISDGGARLRPLLCAPQTLPQEFTLVLSACGKVRRSCRVAWRSRTEVGVQFDRA